MAQKVFSFRLDEGLVRRIDAVGRKRSDFVRDSIEAALRGLQGVSRSVPDVPEKKSLNVPSGLRADSLVLLEALRKRPMSSRDADLEMGWLGLRYGRAEGELLRSGLIVSDCGLLRAVE